MAIQGRVKRLRNVKEAAKETPMALTLTSPAFGEGGPIPQRYAADGDDVSPPLTWSDAPLHTRSYALVCSDPDAPDGNWYHWAVYDLPATTHELGENQPKVVRTGDGRQAVTDFRHHGWGGPCPPAGHEAHRYRFHLMALDIPSLALADSASCTDVERATTGHVLGEAVLTAT